MPASLNDLPLIAAGGEAGKVTVTARAWQRAALLAGAYLRPLFGST
jgi:hypothetical protein